MASPPLRVVWAYDRNHLQHPFIVLGLNTLVEAGCEATIVSCDKAAAVPYRSRDEFSFATRLENWARRTRNRRRITRHIRAIKVAAIRIRRDLSRDVVSAAERIDLLARLAGLSILKSAQRLRRATLKALAYVLFLTVDTWRAYARGCICLSRIEADVVIGSRTEVAIPACIIAKLRGLRFVYYPFELYGEQISRPRWTVAALERLMLRRWVDAVITQNEYRAAILAKERGSRVEPLIVHNYKRTREVRGPGRLRADLAIPAGKRVVLYEGYLVTGRWLDRLAEAVFHLPEDVVIVFLGEEQLKWLRRSEAALARPLASGRLIVAPPVPHDGLLDYVVDADVGVIIYDDKVRNNLFCEPGKLTDYVSAGVPIIAPDFPTIGKVVREHGLGACFDGGRPEVIAGAIMAVLERPKAEWEPALRRAASQLTWETQAQNLIAAASGGK
jgi:glycosyltransferase involved in cell wall biosynthesis